MAITYEEALTTLEAMFGDPWTTETLDAVLRHEKGHMENTCERILTHGSQDPQLLVDRLAESAAAAAAADQQRSSSSPEMMASDEALARQLQGGRGGKKKKGRGTPTELPAGFLQIPGYNHRSLRAAGSGNRSRSRGANTAAAAAAAGSGAGAAAGDAMDDETLARMLQDELFSEELARNPDFAHLAGGGGRGGTGGKNSRTRRAAAALGQRRTSSNQAGAGGAGPGNPLEGINVMDNLSKLGEGARRRLQMFAVNFESRLQGKQGGGGGGGGGGGTANGSGGSALQADSGAVAERRGLLDEVDDDDFEEEIEFEMREKKSN